MSKTLSHLFRLRNGDYVNLHYSEGCASEFREFIELTEKFYVHDKSLSMWYRVPAEHAERFHNLLMLFKHPDWNIRRRAGGGRGPHPNSWDPKDTLVANAKYFRYYINPCKWKYPWYR